MIGSVIGGKYRIDKKIGQGGYGEVYRGYDLNLKRDVAIKMLIDAGYEDAFRKRFLQESEMMAKLMHPNIVGIFDVGEYEGRPYLVLEMVNGPSLAEMAEGTNLVFSQIVKIGIQVCRAMAFAHSKGVIHRDLSLKNIMISESGDVKIVDFGLAKLISAEVRTTSRIIGTPYYLAPEQVTGGRVDRRVDIFAFGVCLYRLANGHFPFEAEHPASVIYQIANEKNIRFNENVPKEWVRVILKCLEKDPDNRYQSFDELAEDLTAIQHAAVDSTVEIRSVGFSYTRSSKRNPYLNRVMIKNPADFFGRQREVTRIFARLDGPDPQSVSIVGDRRIGKSSLLNYVYQKRNRKQFMQNYGDSIFIYMDFQRAGELSVPKFVDILLGMLRYEEAVELQDTHGAKNLEDLKEVIQRIDSTGKRVIILMDEFEAITKNKNFDMQFFGVLRSLANNFRVAYVTSSYSELQELCHTKEIADSPFFNIFTNLRLRPFSPSEALELIGVPSAREGIPLAGYSAQILSLSGHFPLYIQVACSSVFEFLIDNRAAEPNWGEIARCFREEIYPHYAFVWDKIDERSREVICQVAGGKRVGKEYEYVAEDLLRRGYLDEEKGKLALFSPSFREFVLEKGSALNGKSRGVLFRTLFGGGKRPD
jgi:tRNA A-37 threonylcarbamoyl transferase component Bud32